MNKNAFIEFDIETQALPMEVLEQVSKPYPDFDPDSVKVGNRKADTAAAYIKEKQFEHEAGEDDYWAKIAERAAVSPHTGCVIAIGYAKDGVPHVIEGDEKDILTAWWELYEAALDERKNFVFWSGKGLYGCFDPKFLVVRSRILGVQIPGGAAAPWKGRYLNSDAFIDLAAEALCYEHGENLKLSLASMIYNVPGEDLKMKTSDGREIELAWREIKDTLVTGAKWASWWKGEVEDLPEGYEDLHPLSPADQKQIAGLYLKNDILILKGLREKIIG